jgi:transcription elongation GreA/GreB family factor
MSVNTFDIKSSLLNYCNVYVDSRIEFAAKGIQGIRDSANSDSKAMAHLEQEKLATQLEESYKLKSVLSRLDPNLSSEVVEFGSLVFTNQGNFYISIGIGQYKLSDLEVFLVGSSAPLIKAMLGKKKGDKIQFNNRSYEILEIY